MALVQKSNSKRTTVLLIVLFSVIVIGVVVVLVMQSGGSENQSGDIGLQASDLPIVTTFNDEVYSSEQFKSLKEFEYPPLPEDQPGNPNPFQ